MKKPIQCEFCGNRGYIDIGDAGGGCIIEERCPECEDREAEQLEDDMYAAADDAFTAEFEESEA